MPSKFDSRTIQPAASRYTEYTIMAQMNVAWKCDKDLWLFVPDQEIAFIWLCMYVKSPA
jgi:hypothetical protein